MERHTLIHMLFYTDPLRPSFQWEQVGVHVLALDPPISLLLLSLSLSSLHPPCRFQLINVSENLSSLSSDAPAIKMSSELKAGKAIPYQPPRR